MAREDCDYDRTQILYMLHLSLIEIRATQDLHTAKTIADIFHNVPTQLINDLSNSKILMSVDRCAERLGMRRYVEVWKEAGREFSKRP